MTPGAMLAGRESGIYAECEEIKRRPLARREKENLERAA